MTEGPLNENEMEWLEETLISHGHDELQAPGGN